MAANWEIVRANLRQRRERLLRLFLAFLFVEAAVVRAQSLPNSSGPGCSDLWQRRVEVLVQENAGRITFDFFAQHGCGENVLVVPDRKVSTVIVRNVLRDEIWRLEASGDSVPGAPSVRYGDIPNGFRQAVPKFSKPGQLEIYEEYSVEVWGHGRGFASFVYYGSGVHSVRN